MFYFVIGFCAGAVCAVLFPKVAKLASAGIDRYRAWRARKE